MAPDKERTMGTDCEAEKTKDAEEMRQTPRLSRGGSYEWIHREMTAAKIEFTRAWINQVDPEIAEITAEIRQGICFRKEASEQFPRDHRIFRLGKLAPRNFPPKPI